MKEKISLAGDLGSGKSTVSKILIERLGAEYYSTGALVRAVAERRGMTIGELNVYMETHPEIDREIDDGLVALGNVDKLLIIDSRMAWHFTPGTFKVYLSTDIETSAARIMCADRKGEHALTLEETVIQTRGRRESEKKRYFEQYGVHIKDLTNYSLIVDTTTATPDEVAECICQGFDKWCEDRTYSAVFISPERLNYPEIELDADAVSQISEKIELGLPVPTPEVFEKDGEFYLVSGFDTAMAYALSFATFIPAKLTTVCDTDFEYVKMKNSL